MEAIVTFDSTHHALQAESTLQKAGLKPDILPTPRELSASCGLSLSLDRAVLQSALTMLIERGVQFRSSYLVTVNSGRRQFSEYRSEC